MIGVRIYERPSKAEKAATAWHRTKHPGARVDCWCCCRTCRTDNPHYQDARKAALADIAARLEQSVSAGRTAEVQKPSRRARRAAIARGGQSASSPVE